MAKREIQVGTTSRRERVFIADTSQTNGAGLTGLAWNTGGLAWKFIRDDQTTLTSVTPATATAGTWASGGLVEIGNGIYELGLPNAALASSTGVQLLLYGATNMAVTKIEIELTATNNQDAVRGGMTALPNANAGATGGLPQINSGGNVPADLQTIKTQAVAAAAGVTFPASIGTSTLAQAQVTGGAYPLAADGSGFVKISSGAGAGQVLLSSGTMMVGGYAAGEDPASLILAGAVDGQTIASLLAMLKAFAGGLTTVFDNGNGSSTVAFMHADGVTPKLTLTYMRATSARTASTIGA